MSTENENVSKSRFKKCWIVLTQIKIIPILTFTILLFLPAIAGLIFCFITMGVSFDTCLWAVFLGFLLFSFYWWLPLLWFLWFFIVISFFYSKSQSFGLSEMLKPKKLIKPITYSILIFLIPFLMWTCFKYIHYLKAVPQGMGVWRVVYSKEFAAGFGPGANESGLIAYNLPKATATEIIKGGVDYFSKLTKEGSNKNRRGVYKTWYPTPIPKEQEWWYSVPATDELKDQPELYNYLNKYGFGVNVNPAIENHINRLLKTKGSFIAYGRLGVILIAPDDLKVYYFYAG
jgi:hypothetical protein